MTTIKLFELVLRMYRAFLEKHLNCYYDQIATAPTATCDCVAAPLEHFWQSAAKRRSNSLHVVDADVPFSSFD
jgi:hypothetical protein